MSVADLGAADRPHTPWPGDPSLPRYKEWHHFNLIDDASGLDLIVNLSVTGDIHTPDRGQANLVLLAHERGRGWTGDVDIHDGVAVQGRSDRLELAIGLSSLVFADGAYRLVTALGDGSLAAELTFTPLADPMMIWKNTPVGAGHINWLVVPHLRVGGTVRVGERGYEIREGRGYHDHNWGAWRWGENFGWDWGFCADACRIDGEAMSLVYDRTTDRSGSRVREHTLALWVGPQLAKLFTRRMLQARRLGRFEGAIGRRPAAMGLLRHDRVRSVPRRIVISARDGVDWLEADYEVDAALQVAIPNEMDFGAIELNETMGWLTLTGEIGGAAIGCRRRTCFEIVC